MSLPPKRRKFNIRQGTLPALIMLAAAAPPMLIARPVLAQVGAPREATVTASRGKELTLSVGSDDGARPGAIYIARVEGLERARLQIIATRRTESTARLLSAAEGFVLPVGSTVNFLEIAPIEPETKVAPQPVPPVPVAVPKTAPVTVAPVNTPAPVKPLPPVLVSGAANWPAIITAADATTARLNVGTSRGVKAGATLPVMREGNVIALVRVQSVNPDDSSGTIIWRDEATAPPKTGDAVGLIGGSTTVKTPVITTTEAGVPAAPTLFETGASNIGVPTADSDYLYLAGLAAQGLITSQPAHVFNDEGSRRHRTAEDYTFTRAQIAGFVKEALSSPKAENAREKTRVALGALVSEYGKELRRLGVSDESLALFSTAKGFEFGISGQQRATLTGGDDVAGFRFPFSEAQGGLRTKSGFDTRTNLWARSGKFKFLGSVDTGSDPIRGVNSRSFSVRRALLSYDAGKHLRGLTIEAGRDELWLGPGHFGTLGLGDTAGPLNMLKATLKRGSWTTESIYAPLGKGPAGKDRSLYTKNTYVNIGSQSRIGVIENVLDPANSAKPSFLISTFTPFPLFFADRITNSKDNTNYNVEAYIETSLARGVRTYGELLVDDIGVTDKNRVQNRFGTLLGAHFFTPKDPTKLGLYGEYARLNGSTYLDLVGGDPDYNYYYRGVPLGYPVAPPPIGNFGAGRGIGGAESLRIEGYWRALPKLRFYSGVEFADLNSEVSVTPPTVPAPGFSLSRQQIIRLRASYDLSRRITLTARATRVTTSQPNFIIGEPRTQQKLFSLEVARAF